MRSNAAAPVTEGTRGKPQGYLSETQGRGPAHRERAAPRPGTAGTLCCSPGWPGPPRWVQCSGALQRSTHSHQLCSAQTSCSHTVRCRGAWPGSPGALDTCQVLGEQQPGARAWSLLWEGTASPHGATAAPQVSLADFFPAPIRYSSFPGGISALCLVSQPGPSAPHPVMLTEGCSGQRGIGAGVRPSTGKHSKMDAMVYRSVSGNSLSASLATGKIPTDQGSDPTPPKKQGQEHPPLWPAMFSLTRGMNSGSCPRCCAHLAPKPAPPPGPPLPSCCPGRRRALHDQAPRGQSAESHRPRTPPHRPTRPVDAHPSATCKEGDKWQVLGLSYHHPPPISAHQRSEQRSAGSKDCPLVTWKGPGSAQIVGQSRVPGARSRNGCLPS